MMTWHLDDGVLGHTCHGDGVLDEALVACYTLGFDDVVDTFLMA